MSRRLFVYGTLMRGEVNAQHLRDARYLGPAATAPAYTLLDLGPYPAMTAGGTTAVRGELYDVDASTLLVLDAFEEHPEVYVRSPVRLGNGEAAEAYLLRRVPRDVQPLLGGDWRERR